MSSRKKVVIDCDAGTDDAHAIMMVLAYHDAVDLLAITTVFGNTNVKNVNKNVFKTLKICNKPDVPVYEGCSSTLVGNPEVGDIYHGHDGFGDVKHYSTGDKTVEDEHATSALMRLAKENQGELVIVALGPLTNLATVLKIDPDFGKNIKELCIMGGNTTGQGNMTVCAEFNFYSDPEAAQCVLNHMSAPITLVHKEVCEKYSFTWEWYDRLCSVPTEKAKFIKDIEAFMVSNAKKTNTPLYWCWDQLATSIIIDESIIKGTQEVYATVELGGTYTRGQVVVDTRGMLKRPKNVKLLTEVDLEKYEVMLLAAVEKQ